MTTPHRHLPSPHGLLPGVLYLALLAGLYLADWLASLRGDETRWLAPLVVAALTVVTVAAVGPMQPGPARRRQRPTVPRQRPPRD